MNVRRFEHTGKGRFWEIYWDLDGVETVSGVLGTKGRASRKTIGSRSAFSEYLEGQIAAHIKQGFVETRLETAAAAPQAAPAPDWIARIAAAYDDDAPRLVYADWLQQQGDPLGEFIMLQCERARLDRWEPRQKPMREREEHMLSLYRNRWLPDLATANVEFERGFVERIRLGNPPDLAQLARIRHFAPLAWLDLGQNTISEAGCRALAEAALPELRFLNVSGNQVGDVSRIRKAFPQARVVARLARGDE